MSGTNDSAVHVGCPRCNERVSAMVPPGPGIVSGDETETNRLRGTAAPCENCGHAVELYFY